jgi:DNA-binding response OmpR family regulator
VSQVTEDKSAAPRSSRASKILAVEDDLAVGMVLRFACKQAGHELELANDIRSGRAALEKSTPDLVLLDLHLPDGHGFELLRYIREDLGRSTPVIVLSGVKQWDSITRGMRLGASEYMTKPFSPQGLLEHVQGWTAIAVEDAPPEEELAADGTIYVST